MKLCLVSLAVVLLFIVAPLHAQNNASTSRVSRQHKLTNFQKQHMKQSEESILASILSESIPAQKSAIQTLRDLEQIAPEYPFASLIAPLADRLKNEQSDRVVRKLAALALDELHSDAGDLVITEMAQHAEDVCLKSLCETLLVRSNSKE
jgi:hypothetical protein